jgi:NADH dehydrogenase
VLVLGAGFAGLWAARALSRTPADVLLVDRNNYHTFQPLLYQVAAAELSPESIAHPVRSITRRLPNVRFAQVEVGTLDLAGHAVQTSNGAVGYDYLLLALGSSLRFFGVPGAAEHTHSLKSLEDSIRLRNHVLRRFEFAERNASAQSRQQALTFVIIGGGPTGVEYAGALMELIRGPLAKDYSGLALHEARVVLMEATDQLLPGLPESLRAYAAARLAEMGVEVRCAATVNRVTPQAVLLADGSFISAETVIWTAGVRGTATAEAWGLPLTPAGRIAVLPTLQLPGYPEVYAVGDLAAVDTGRGPLPLTAPVAIQEGQWAARNMIRQIAGRAPTPFRYRDRGAMATIGRNAAVATLKGWNFTGFLAWIVWLTVHLYHLVGFRNRLLVMINWAWDYVFFERGVRLILPSQATGRPPGDPMTSPVIPPACQ